jgi:16S rRNA (guanine527-N7)-methyltransferase
MTSEDALARGVDALALELPAETRARLLAYLALVRKWNRVYNLTAIRDPVAMVTHHLLDSLAVIPHLSEERTALISIADVGSGAGLPGIPLALARPDWRVTLNDRSSKKAAFLRQAKIELALANVAVHEGDAASWHPPFRFDCVITRAFSALTDYVATCRHLVAPGGLLAAMQGVRRQPEGEAPNRGVDCHDVRRLQVPLLDAERHLVLCRVQKAAA